MNNDSTVFSHEQIDAARKADLYSFLLTHHASLFKIEGNSIRLLSNPSVSIRKGFCGYLDFSTGCHGNSVSFLIDEMEYTFPQAVAALLQSTSTVCPVQNAESAKQSSSFHIPTMYVGEPSRARQYLVSRGIPLFLVNELFSRKLLYESADYHNLVFLSKNRDYAEIRGTFPGRKFHGCRKISKDRFWAYREIGVTPQKAYVCESAIDALSLCLLRQYECHKFLFCSIGGVANQSAIDRIKRFLPVIIAVDNDDAGERCRKNNPDVPFIIPTAKDWNDDLQMLKQSRNKSKT